MRVLDRSQERYMLEELYNMYKGDVETACAGARLMCDVICCIHELTPHYVQFRELLCNAKVLSVLVIAHLLRNIARVYVWLGTRSHINPSDGKILANTNQKFQVKCLVDGVDSSFNCIMQKLCDNNNIPEDVMHNILNEREVVYDCGKRLLSDLGFE